MISSDDRLGESISNLWSWLSTWMDESFGLHGYVVHHHRDNLRITSPDTWTQAASLLGCLNLYETNHRDYWLDTASKLGSYLVDNYIRSMHVFLNSNHEHKPLGKPEVISNALPSYALLRLSQTRKNIGVDFSEYYAVAVDNVMNYLLKGWNPSVGAIASLDQGKDHFVLNMNGISAMALTSLALLKEDETILNRFVKSICDFITRWQIQSGPLKGAYPYRAATSRSIALYSLITAYALTQVSSTLRVGKYLESAEAAFKNLMQFFDPELGLMPHYHMNSAPYWLPDTVLLYSLGNGLQKLGSHSTSIPNSLSKLLKRQYSHGGFPLSIGFADDFDRRLISPKPSLRRWRDILPTPNWNAWIFWGLTELTEGQADLPNACNTFPLTIVSDEEEIEGPYTIKEDRPSVSFTDKNGNLVGLFIKKNDVAALCSIHERNEAYRLKVTLDRYPRLIQKAISKGAQLFK